MSREDPPSRLAKMGAMPTPFRGSDRPEDAEREEHRSETPPGKRVPACKFQKVQETGVYS